MLAFRVIQIEQHRTLQQRPANLSRPELCRSNFSLANRSLPDTLHGKLNRLAELDRAVAPRKQTAENSSNRQKIQKRLSSISAPGNFFSTQNFANCDSQSTELPMRKKGRFSQSGRPLLPGATTTPSRAPEFHKIAQGFDELHY
jgi:hypothetical protein